MKIGELNQKIQQKLQNDQEMLEQTLQANLNDLEKSLQKSMQAVASTIESNMQIIENHTKLLMKASLKAKLFNFCLMILLSMGLILGIFLASTNISIYLINKINTLQAQIESLEQEQQTRTKTLQKLQTWGIQTYEDKNGHFLVLPQGMTASTDWKVGDQKAIKLETK